MTTTTETKTATISSIDFSLLLRSNIPQYKKILVPHDSSEMSDKSLAHAGIYQKKLEPISRCFM